MGRPYIPKRFLGAFKAGHRAASREFIDEKFAYQLLKRILDSNYSDLEAVEALDYLTKFNNEYHKAVLKKNDPNSLHNTEHLYQDRSSANNARNRDIMSILRHRVDSLTPTPIETSSGPQLTHTDIQSESPEDMLIAFIDLKNELR